MKMEPGNYSGIIENTLINLRDKNIVNRIWKKDHTVWRENPEEISNRLGWLDCLEVSRKSLNEINSFVEEIRKEGFRNALLMGMGGSSLTPEVFRFTFGVENGYLDLHVIDRYTP